MYQYSMFYSIQDGSRTTCKSEPLSFLTAKPTPEQLEKIRQEARKSLMLAHPLATYIFVALPIESTDIVGRD